MTSFSNHAAEEGLELERFTANQLGVSIERDAHPFQAGRQLHRAGTDLTSPLYLYHLLNIK